MTHRPPDPRGRRRAAQGLLHRLGVTALALALFATSGLGGARYLWCKMASQTQLHCCCPPGVVAATIARAQPATTLSSSSCCEAHQIGTVPTSTGGSDAEPSVHAAPLAAVLPLALWLAGVAGDEPRDATFAQRDLPRVGPEPPLYALHRRYLN